MAAGAEETGEGPDQVVVRRRTAPRVLPIPVVSGKLATPGLMERACRSWRGTMCGIVGAVAERDVVPVLMEGLRRLEYRGYDSAGIAVLNGSMNPPPLPPVRQ